MNKMPDEIFASIKHKWDDCLTGNWTTIDENTALTSYTRTSILEAERAAQTSVQNADLIDPLAATPDGLVSE